jgi:protein-S-isoprenylcysteine O-methyltransferase Ste14
MFRIIALAYGVGAYAVFFVTFLYLFAFMGNIAVPKSIDTGTTGPLGWAILIDSALVALFVVQHTIMARGWFKSWWTRIVPRPIERSTFVLATSAALILLFLLWRPIPAIVWDMESPAIRVALWLLFGIGLFVVLYSSFLIDHFDLFGLRQVFFCFRDREYSRPAFVVRSLYSYIRHPLMAGFLISIWAVPTMTVGHLLFSSLLTAYIFFGTRIEERELVSELGADYERYQEETPMLVPFPKKRKTGQATQTS